MVHLRRRILLTSNSLHVWLTAQVAESARNGQYSGKLGFSPACRYRWLIVPDAPFVLSAATFSVSPPSGARLVNSHGRTLAPYKAEAIFSCGRRSPRKVRRGWEGLIKSVQVIAGLLGAAQRRLGREGLSFIHLREAARRQAELRDPTPPLMESTSNVRRGGHSHRRLLD